MRFCFAGALADVGESGMSDNQRLDNRDSTVLYFYHRKVDSICASGTKLSWLVPGKVICCSSMVGEQDI